MRRFLLSLPCLPAVSAGDFFDGRISVHTHTPIGVDGRWTAWRDALAARLGVCRAAEGRDSGSGVKVRLRGLWFCGFLFLWPKVGEVSPPQSGAFRATGRRTFVHPGVQRWTNAGGWV